MQKYEDSCKGLCALIKQHWRNVVYVEATRCGIWPDIDNKTYQQIFHDRYRPNMAAAGFTFADGKLIWPHLAPYLHEAERYHMGSIWREDSRQNAAYKILGNCFTAIGCVRQYVSTEPKSS